MISAILFRRGWCEDPPHKKIRTSRNGNRANSAQGGRNPTCKLQNHVHYFYSYVFLLADIPQIAVDFSLILPPFRSRDKESRCAWKRIQYCYADRIVLIEAWFRGEHPDNIAPFQIFSSWAERWDNHYKSLKSLGYILRHRFVYLPYFPICLLGFIFIAIITSRRF